MMSRDKVRVAVMLLLVSRPRNRPLLFLTRQHKSRLGRLLCCLTGDEGCYLDAGSAKLGTAPGRVARAAAVAAHRARGVGSLRGVLRRLLGAAGSKGGPGGSGAG